jgi:hypothetical protein
MTTTGTVPKKYRQIRLKKETYLRLVNLGDISDTLDKLVSRMLDIATPTIIAEKEAGREF